MPIRVITVTNEEELVNMSIIFSVPEDFAEPGRHTLKLNAIGDGADYASFDYVINVPSECINQ